jgi:hypothetical protein
MSVQSHEYIIRTRRVSLNLSRNMRTRVHVAVVLKIRTACQWRTQEIFGGGGGFNKFSWQSAERTGVWGRQPPNQGFRSICKWVKSVFLLGCRLLRMYFHGTGNSIRVWTPPHIPPRYSTAACCHMCSPSLSDCGVQIMKRASVYEGHLSDTTHTNTQTRRYVTKHCVGCVVTENVIILTDTRRYSWDCIHT